MTTVLPDLTIAGLDTRRLNIIRRRWHILDQHLSPYFSPDKPWFVTLRSLGRQHQVHLILVTLEHAVHNADQHGNPSAQQVTPWYERVGAPLARELDFQRDAEQKLISICRGRGWFDLPGTKPRASSHPELMKIVPKVRSILKAYSTIEERAEQLYAQQLCRTKAIAQKVAEELGDRHITRHAIGMLLHLLGMFSTYDAIGLLSLTHDMAADELLLLEDQAAYIKAITPNVAEVLGELRADIIALYDGLRSVHPELWQPHLFNEPLHSNARSYYCKRLYPRLRRRIIAAIAKYRSCDEATAAQLFDCFVERGLAGMAEMRAGLDRAAAQDALERQRLLTALTFITIGMASWAQQECERLVLHLLAAARAVGLPNSLKPLIDQFPSSPLRIRWGRRFWFGLPSIMQRKQRHRCASRIRGSRGRTAKPQTNQQPKPPSREDKLVEIFAELAQLDAQDARNRVRNFLTYGVLGLLPRGQWRWVLDPQFMSWLYLIKLGHLDGAVMWSEVLQAASDYTQLLGVPRPSAQVLRAIFNSLPKPSYWHGGKGRSVHGMHQRATLNVKDRPQLHRVWFVLPITIRLSLGNTKQRVYFLLLIVDEASGLPVGGWLSETAPGLREVRLALYQAIWHPGIIDWPLHGIPKTVRIPAELLRSEIGHLEERATHALEQISKPDEEEPTDKMAADEQRFSLLGKQTHIRYVFKERNTPLGKVLRWLAEGNIEAARALTLPRPLLSSGLHELDRAARFLLTNIEIVDKISLEGKPSIRALRDKLRKQGATVIAKALDRANPSLDIALTALLAWLEEQCFPDHRIAPVPDEIARYTVGMAGWNTLAAGWLLPAHDQVVVDGEGLTWQLHRYRTAPGQLESGTRVIVHAFPFTFSRRSVSDQQLGVFGEIDAEGAQRLIYLDCVA
jgi:hypothetical protein